MPRFNNPGKFAQAEQYTLATIAFVLNDALIASGFTQRQLADKLGVSEARVWQLLNETGNLTAKTLARIADALNCKVQIKFVARDTEQGKDDR